MDKTLAEYIKSLKNQLITLENWELSEALEQVSDTYTAMLKFHMQGAHDPKSTLMQKNLWSRVQSIQQRIWRLRRLKDYPIGKYSTALREVRDIDISSLATRLELVGKDQGAQEQFIVQLFKWTLSSDQWKNGEYEICMQILTSDNISGKAKAVMVAAVNLSNLEYFDEHKMMFLLDAYLLDDKEISQRALVGIVLSLRKDAELIGYFPDIEGRLDILCDDDTFVLDSYTVLVQLQMSSLTNQVSNKIRDDIMPSIVKGSAKLKKQMGMLEINDKLTENGENPEWLKVNEENDSKAEEKIREMTDMQLNGEDVYMATFAMLKGFRFFNEMAHWFYPFTIDDPELSEFKAIMESDNGRFMRALLNNSPFCNSDKYSLCFLTGTLGNGGFEAIANQMEAQMSDLDEEEKSAMLDENTNRQHKTSYYSRLYIFDLYRFYNLYGFRTEFYNPFADAQKKLFSPLEISPLRKLTTHAAMLLDHADFLMRKEYYREALAEFDIYGQNAEHSVELFQKIGFCHQKLQEWEKAKQNYITADSIKPNSKWTLSHLGKVCILAGDYESALSCYRLLCEMDEENTHYLLRYAEMQKRNDLLSDAIDTLYKANYVSPDSPRIRRQLALYLLENKQTDKAIDFLDTSIDQGLAHIVAGNIAEAYNCLSTAYHLLPTKEDFSEHFKEAAQLFFDANLLTPLQTELFYDAILQEI